MKFRFVFLSVLLISIGCSSEKHSIDKREKTSGALAKYGVTITPISDEVKVEFVTSLPSDTLFPYSSDTFEPITGHEGYLIDAESSFEEMVQSYLKQKFPNRSEESTLRVLVALNDIGITESSHELTNDGSGLTTEAESFVYVEIYNGIRKVFSELLISNASVSNQSDSYKESHLASIESVHESALIKIYGLFKECNTMECVLSKENGNTVDGLEGVNVISVSADGNLQSFEPIEECVDIDEVSTINTPADILPASRRCIDIGEYEKGFRLYLLSRFYAFYDMKRVKDGSAHQAILMLEEQTYSTLSREQMKSFSNEAEKYQSDTTVKLMAACDAVQKLGAPEYHPIYMIQHGMEAFFASEDDDGIVEEFDSGKTWIEVLTEMGCMAN